jgi:general secretion pathway protein A
MYEEHFGLKMSPFALGPDPQFIFLTDKVREALAILSYGASARKGFIQLVGDVGTGKTTLLNIFLDWLRERGDSAAFICNPHVKPDEFLDLMWADLGIDRNVPLKSQMLLRFNQWLLERYDSGRLAVLVVDEAQQLSPEVLEELRLLTNLETPNHRLLQIILSGQPELETVLENPALRQLRQRITLRCRTTPFTQAQTCAYIQHRLRVAGAAERLIFSPSALASVHFYSKGIARIINVLCEQAMIDAFCDSSDRVTANIVTKVARDVVGSAALRDATPAQRETLLRDEEKVGESAEGMQVLKRSCL